MIIRPSPDPRSGADQAVEPQTLLLERRHAVAENDNVARVGNERHAFAALTAA